MSPELQYITGISLHYVNGILLMEIHNFTLIPLSYINGSSAYHATGIHLPYQKIMLHY